MRKWPTHVSTMEANVGRELSLLKMAINMANADYPSFFLWNELEPRCQHRAAGSLELPAPINGQSISLRQLLSSCVQWVDLLACLYSVSWPVSVYSMSWLDSAGMTVIKQADWQARGGGGGGTPYVMGDTYVPRFWPPFFTLAGSSTIFLGYFSHPPTAKLSFGVQKLPIFTKIDLFGPKFNFFLDLFGSNFQRPAAHPHQFSGRVPPPPHTGVSHPSS